MLSEWATSTSGTTDAGGGFTYRGFHGDYDITLTAPGGPATLRRISLEPGSGTSTHLLVINPTDSRPVLHSTAISGDGSFRFSVSSYAGISNQILSSSTLGDWAAVADTANPNGTISFTNPNTIGQPQLYFRARLLP